MSLMRRTKKTDKQNKLLDKIIQRLQMPVEEEEEEEEPLVPLMWSHCVKALSRTGRSF